ncbi:MAG: SRPBCC family protein [Acidimicrobiia bacterium]
MAHYLGTVTTDWTPDQAFAYMADARNFAEWDPGTETSRLENASEPGPGAVFAVKVHVGPPTVTFHYVTVRHEPPQPPAAGRVTLRAENFAMELVDDITVDVVDGVTTVTYEATVTPRGVTKIFGPIFDRGFQKTAAKGADGLRARLARPYDETTGPAGRQS